MAQIFIGLPQWQHEDWLDGPLGGSGSSLRRYARHFSSVEGNSTFYGLPSAKVIDSWIRDTPEEFRFCFKFHRDISHQGSLNVHAPEVCDQLNRLARLHSRLGLICLQLPATFGPERLGELEQFLKGLSCEYRYSVEVRHAEFFAKGDAEKRFHEILREHQVNRVMFDTRALFDHPAKDAATLDALKKKPQVPLHRVATGNFPQVRFISPMDLSLAEPYLDQWVEGVVRWLEQGKKPFLFFHTPDNAQAPALSARFVEKLVERYPDVKGFNPWQPPGEQVGLALG